MLLLEAENLSLILNVYLRAGLGYRCFASTQRSGKQGSIARLWKPGDAGSGHGSQVGDTGGVGVLWAGQGTSYTAPYLVHKASWLLLASRPQPTTPISTIHTSMQLSTGCGI